MAKRENTNKRDMGELLIIFLTAAILVVSLLFCVVFILNGRKDGISRTYEPDTQSVGNPLMGYAPRATKEEMPEDVSLVYVDITWRELEPEKGVFDFEGIEEDNQFERWRQEGKHVVLRFVCDEPSEESARDIPDWLYEETGKDGEWYDISYGKGYAPNYDNPVFIENHARAVKALGEKYGQDSFISYIELGSLGHWGEWHVKYDEGLPRMPKEQIRDRYITPWIEAFPNAKIMMRRPFNPAKEYGFGLFNDMAGHLEDTEEWLAWIEEGGDYSQANEENALAAMPDYWKTAPSGGELTSSLSMEDMLVVNLAQTVDLAERSHTTFLGPKGADAAYAEGYDELLRHMGYRLYISEAALTRSGSGAQLKMVWENLGAAPIYWDWPVNAYVIKETGEVVETVSVDIRLSTLLPGEKMSCAVKLETEGLLSEDHGRYAIGVGIVDPMTGECAVRLDMQARRQYGMTILFD